MAPEARTHLQRSASSPAVARRFVRDVLRAWDCDDPEDVAALLTSEAVTNAVVHAATRLELELTLDAEAELLRVEVRDGDATPPVVRHVPSTATGGRGMALIEALARSWGSAPTEDGKVVWFEVDVAGLRSRGTRGPN